MVGVATLDQDVDDDVGEDDEEDLEDEEEEPEVDMFEVGRLGQGDVDGGEEGGENQERGERAHEPVGEVTDVDTESDVGQEPEEERLQVGGGEVGGVESVEEESECEPGDNNDYL